MVRNAATKKVPVANKDMALSPIRTIVAEDTEADNLLDRMLHASVGRFTGNISPCSLGMAGLDWWMHLTFSPEKMLSLYRNLLSQSSYLALYAANAYNGPLKLAELHKEDTRFKDESWQQWPFNVFKQSFLACEDWWKIATTSNMRGVSRHHKEVVSFVARQLLDMVSPSNNPFTNPEILHATANEGGANFLRGFNYWLEDMHNTASDAPPAGAEAFEVGKNIAVTPGKVVYRNNLMELIQYSPATTEVYAEPLLIVPAWIMKYYILDLSPENSLVKYLVGKGHTVFMISWKNPDGSDRNLCMEDYIHTGFGEALTAVNSITGKQVHTVGYCIGGTLLSIAASALASKGDNRIKTVTLLAAQTDFQEAGELMLFIDESQVAYLEDAMWQQGYLDKYQMAGAFQMLHSNDLIWSRLIHDYLEGKRQPLNDLMAWNADATRMPYKMHSEYLRNLFLNNDLTEGRLTVNGEPVALKDIHCPVFAVGTVRDHVAPWKSVYKIHLFVDSEVTFVLTSGGHNAGIVSEPGHKGRTYQIASAPKDANYVPPLEWQQRAQARDDSWWEAWQNWLTSHSSDKQNPPAMGNKAKGYVPLEDAPGRYVLAK